MGLKHPRGKFERLDYLIPARIWRKPDRSDAPVGCTCRNISARGCRLRIENASLVPDLEIDHVIQFRFQLGLQPLEILGSGKVAWIKKERGDPGKICLICGIEFTTLSFQDREHIKAFIAKQLGEQPQ